MIKYAKIINNETGLCDVGTGSNIAFYKSIGMVELDVEQSDINGNWYLSELCPKKSDEEKLNDAKQAKIQENDLKRDEALNQGVEYKGVLFDSDTDQKVNLLAIVSTMEEQSALLEGEVSAIADEGGSLKTIIWYGKDNQPLECSKEDLINIGGLITQLHTFCWNKNAQIKALINEAQTIEEVEAIVIDYIMPETFKENENMLESEEDNEYSL